ncbi:MAG: hypothetical protein ABR950_01200 [Candidatus Dormibacteria bacterium]|jgi:hypothetical protein
MIHTRDGRPLQRSGDDLHSRSGRHVARMRGRKAYGPSGVYVGTLLGDRLVYRAGDSVSLGVPFLESPRAGFSAVNAIPANLLGEEPPLPD